jgi:acyl-CoA hydrolase/GNAT superfamily N-acetyltransferase
MAVQYWPDAYQGKRKTPQQAVQLIKPGQRVFIGSSCGEPQRLVKELANQSACFTDLEIVRLLSLESTPLTLIADQSACTAFNVRSFYLGSAKPKELAANKRFLTPINLSAVPRLFKSRALPIHVALIQVSEPDDFGWMSLGISVDVTMAAAQNADLVIAQVNPQMPRTLGRSFIHANEVDAVVECDEPLLTIGEPPDVLSAMRIAEHVAGLIDDGSTLQMSLGASPKAVLSALSHKNDLGVHTQFLSEPLMKLVAQGVITNRKKGFIEEKLVASAAVGSQNLYEFCNDNPSIEFHPSDFVNDPAIIARNHKMVAINVVMAMDLTGQAAADALPYNHYSGVSGMMDFMRGSQSSPGGKSVLMLPSTTLDGQASRIVTSLDDIPVVVPRGEVQYVVTEYGVVNLFGKSLQERALAMISVAHPDFREELLEQAKEAGLLGRERTLGESLHGVYPVQWEETADINGQRVLIRPVKPTDERLVQEHFYQLPMEDVVRRFFHEKTSFLRTDVGGFYQVDYVKNLTLVAVVGEPGFEKAVAVGGYFLEPAKNLAEVAFSTDKAWQGKGLSSLVLHKLAHAARENGIAGLVAYTSPGNQAMIRLFQKLPYKIRTAFDGEFLTMTCRFDEPLEKPMAQVTAGAEQEPAEGGPPPAGQG